MIVRATLDHKIRTPMDGLPENVRPQILDALSIPNTAKDAAEKAGRWGWQNMPDYIDLYELEGDDLVMPRGFASAFADGLRLTGHEVEWTDNRTWNKLLPIGNKPTPRPWQEKAIPVLMQKQQGIYKAPAGSGKTVTILFTIKQLGCKSLIIINTKDILWQWQERVAQFLGESYPCGQIGDGVFEVSPYITIATAQTLNSRFEALEAEGFFDEFSFVCLDECHHATAETYNRILDRFSARYRIGVSATPDKTGDFALATNVLGPIIHETRPHEVTTLMKPEVIRVPTKFQFAFRGARNGRQSNYSEMLTALVGNEDRNRLIVNSIMREEGHHQLVISKRLQHLELFEQMLLDDGFPDPIVKIRGVDDNDARKDAKALAEEHPCVVLSTLADEAMDIPRLDRMHLTFPQKNAGLVTQQVGRVEREHPDKEDALIFDYCDMNVGPLEKQWRVRRFEVYVPRGYKITTRKAMPTI